MRIILIFSPFLPLIPELEPALFGPPLSRLFAGLEHRGDDWPTSEPISEANFWKKNYLKFSKLRFSPNFLLNYILSLFSKIYSYIFLISPQFSPNIP